MNSPFLFNPTAGFDGQSVASGATQSLFLAAANTKGATLLAFSFILQANAGTDCSGRLRTATTLRAILGGIIKSGPITGVPFILQTPLWIPAGVGLEFANIVSPANLILNGAWIIH